MIFVTTIRIIGDIFLLKHPFYIYILIVLGLAIQIAVLVALHKNIKPPSRFNLKITNFGITSLLCLLYIGIFVILLISIRYLAFNSSFDLKEIWYMFKKISQMPMKFQFIIWPGFFSIFLLWLGLFVYLRLLLKLELKKMFIYAYGCGLVSRNAWGYKFTNYFMHSYWSYDHVFSTIPSYIYGLIKKLYADKHEAQFVYSKIFKLFSLGNFSKKCQKFAFLILWGLIAYEIACNNFVLSFTFKYLFFYVLFSFWVNVSFKFKEVDYYLIRMLWEIYYSSKTIYVNLVQAEEAQIDKAVKSNCKFMWEEGKFEFTIYPYHKRFVKMSADEAKANNFATEGFKNENWHDPSADYTKCFGIEELREVDGRNYVLDQEEPETFAEYEFLRANHEKTTAKKKGK